MSFSPLPRHLIAEHVRFSTEDRARIARCRRSYNRLGFAYQLAFLRLIGRFPHHQPIEIWEDLLTYVGLQLDLDPKEIEHYAQRRQTSDAHAEHIRQDLGYQTFGEGQHARLGRFLEEEVEHLEQTSALIARAEEFLRAQKILVPATSTLRRFVIEQRACPCRSG